MPDRVAEHYDRHAHAFDQARRGAFVERAWFDRFLLGVRRGGRILDLGCGGGEPVDRYLIDHGYAVTGVDAAEKMVALARIRFARQRWLNVDMRKLVISEKFDGILAWDSLFHLHHQDQAAMLIRMAGWLAVEGAMMFNTGPAWDGVAGCQFGESLYHASLDPWEYRTLFEQLGLTEVAFAPDDPAAGGRTVWLVKKLA
jgi:cyclopropane fatty-acyl-phospholipid synthase-like methyltransferase